MRYTAFFVFVLLFMVTTTYAQDIPANAWKSGNSWYCNDGYRKQGNQCIKLRVPENAWVSGSNWYCNDGYQKRGNECVKFRVPNNAWVSGSNWYCNDGYRKQGDECIKLKVPKNAWVSGSNWYCNNGYRKQGDECVKFEIPANAFAQGGQWYCKEGYKKQGDNCTKMSQDELIRLKRTLEEQKASLSDGTIAFQTRVDDDSGDIIKLENGAIIKVSSYFGYLGYRKKAVLFVRGYRCRIWIAGKKAYNCELLKSPEKLGEPAREVHITEVKGNGTILIMLDGSIFEVDSIDQIHTLLWLGLSYGLLINGTTLINFDADEAVKVHRIR